MDSTSPAACSASLNKSPFQEAEPPPSSDSPAGPSTRHEGGLAVTATSLEAILAAHLQNQPNPADLSTLALTNKAWHHAITASLPHPTSASGSLEGEPPLGPLPRWAQSTIRTVELRLPPAAACDPSPKTAAERAAVIAAFQRLQLHAVLPLLIPPVHPPHVQPHLHSSLTSPAAPTAHIPCSKPRSSGSSSSSSSSSTSTTFQPHQTLPAAPAATPTTEADAAVAAATPIVPAAIPAAAATAAALTRRRLILRLDTVTVSARNVAAFLRSSPGVLANWPDVEIITRGGVTLDGALTDHLVAANVCGIDTSHVAVTAGDEAESNTSCQSAQAAVAEGSGSGSTSPLPVAAAGPSRQAARRGRLNRLAAIQEEQEGFEISTSKADPAGADPSAPALAPAPFCYHKLSCMRLRIPEGGEAPVATLLQPSVLPNLSKLFISPLGSAGSAVHLPMAALNLPSLQSLALSSPYGTYFNDCAAEHAYAGTLCGLTALTQLTSLGVCARSDGDARPIRGVSLLAPLTRLQKLAISQVPFDEPFSQLPSLVDLYIVFYVGGDLSRWDVAHNLKGLICLRTLVLECDTSATRPSAGGPVFPSGCLPALEELTFSAISPWGSSGLFHTTWGSVGELIPELGRLYLGRCAQVAGIRSPRVTFKDMRMSPQQPHDVGGSVVAGAREWRAGLRKVAVRDGVQTCDIVCTPA